MAVQPATNRYTADGTNQDNFSQLDWGLLGATSLIWGSSFLWIAIGLDAFHPGTIALIRMVIGAAVLWLIPAARVPIPRSEWSAMAVVAVAGNAAPAVLFPLAQQRIDSSVAGMINSVSPILVLAIAVLMTRRAPVRLQIIGLTVGLVGAVLLALPNVAGADAEPLGVALVLLAVLGYATSNNFLPPLQQKYGGTAVIARALTWSSLLLLPYGAYGIANSSFAWSSAVALFILGVLGTGFARSFFATLTGRVGAPRSSMVGYLVPVVAIVLGVLVRGESVGTLELLGTGVVLLGAYLISRGRQERTAQDE